MQSVPTDPPPPAHDTAPALGLWHRIRRHSALLVLTALLAAWGGYFIYQSSFFVEGTRYFSLYDDPMISMTYARNLVEGFGLNWARFGEPVEGFTHPLWVLAMVPINALPIPLELRSLALQVLSLLLLITNVWCVRRLVLAHFTRGRARSWLPAAVLTAFYYPLSFWALVGMETGLQSLLTILTIHEALNLTSGRPRRYGPLAILLCAGFLLRMDMALLGVATVAHVALCGGLPRSEWRRWGAAAALALLACSSYLVFRRIYFGDWLPNTYYLKLSGVPLELRLARGLDFLVDFALPILLPLFVGLTGALLLRRADRNLKLPAFVLVLYCAYSVYAGGDTYEDSVPQRANRFIAFALPAFFVLLNALANHALEWLNDWRPSATRDRVLVATATLTCLALFNGLWIGADTSAAARRLIGFDPPVNRAQLSANVSEIKRAEAALKPGATVAVVSAGQPSFFTRLRMADVLGYNDRVIAHGPMADSVPLDEARRYLPGHHKWDYEHILGRVRPDLVMQTWGLKRSAATQIMTKHGYVWTRGWWRRVGSSKVKDSLVFAQ